MNAPVFQSKSRKPGSQATPLARLELASAFGFRPSFGFLDRHSLSGGGRISDFGFKTSGFGFLRGFTLVEVLLALSICAIILVAINAVFASAFRLREATVEKVEQRLPVSAALDLLRRDLNGTVGPGGFLLGDFKCGAATMGLSMGLSGEAGGSGLDFFTSTGQLSESNNWADVQEVFYELKAPTDRNQIGLDFVRCVNRNLLALSTPTPEVQALMGHVQSIQFDCYDGSQWQNTWDTSSTGGTGNTNLPNAVRVRIQMSPLIQGSAPTEPIEMIVPLLTQTLRTNQVSKVP